MSLNLYQENGGDYGLAPTDSRFGKPQWWWEGCHGTPEQWSNGWCLSDKDVLETVGSSSHTGWQGAGTVWIKKWWMHLLSMPAREDLITVA